MTLHTGYAESLALKQSGVELPIESGDSFYRDGDFLLRVQGDTQSEDVRAFTFDELMQMPEYREIDIVMFNSGSAGFRVEWLANHKRVGELYPDLQSALNKVASLIAQHRKG